MTEKRLIIEATITTVGPLNIKLPLPEGKKEMPFDAFPVQARGLGEDLQTRRTAYLPATTVRGFLRRSATLARMKRAAADGKPYKMKAIYKELIGQDSASEEKSAEGQVDLLAIERERDENPVLDLFGCGLGMKSRLMVGHFTPDADVLPEAYMAVRKDIDSTEGVLALMDQQDVQAFYSRSSNNSKKSAASALLKKLRRELKIAEKESKPLADLQTAITVTEKNIEDSEADMAGMTNSSLMPVGYYALRSGVDLRSRIVVMKARDRDLQIILDGLNDLSLTPVLGGNVARGCGEISGKFHIKDETGRLLKTVSIGGFQPAIVQNF